MMGKRKYASNRGQALVEFALILTVLLMLIFLIIESARILWAWVTVQNAAREGARYATTGQFMGPDCPIEDLAKFVDKCDPDSSELARVSSIIWRSHEALAGLPLDETSGIFEDDNYYNIEVWGAFESEEQGRFLRPDFGGVPDGPVVVRVTYRVPIITPFFRPIMPSIPVFGQVTMNNESFGRLGNATQGQGVPPPLPELPTPGVTPSPTNTPTETPIPTEGAPPTPTVTDTPTATATVNVCRVRFEGAAVAGNNFVFVTGEVGSIVTIINLTTGDTLGAMQLVERDGHLCPGFGDFSPPYLNQLLVQGHVLLAQSSDGTYDTTIVLGAPPTLTPTPTFTLVPSPTTTNTPTPTATGTPNFPYIQLLPNCGAGPNVSFNIIGDNWPPGEAVALYWNSVTTPITTIAAGHPGFFQVRYSPSGLTNGVYRVIASSQSASHTADFRVPCSNITPTPPTATPTGTPAPADLIIVGPPALVSTRPIVAYQPVQFSMVISNTGGVDVNNLFFVDLYFNPTTVLSTHIPITQSVGYVAVSSLAGGASRTITVTSPLGFANSPATNTIYGMVDSVRQIAESIETNNISTPAAVAGVIPAATPTPTPTPDPTGTEYIAGSVRTFLRNWIPQYRANVTLREGTRLVNTTTTDINGFYEFNNVPSGTYTVSACLMIDGQSYFGQRTGVQPPNSYVDIFMMTGACP